MILLIFGFCSLHQKASESRKMHSVQPLHPQSWLPYSHERDLCSCVRDMYYYYAHADTDESNKENYALVNGRYSGVIV